MHCEVDELVRLYDSLLYDVVMEQRVNGVVAKSQQSRTLTEGVALRLILAFRRISQSSEEFEKRSKENEVDEQ